MIVHEIYDSESTRTYSDRGMLIHGGFPEADYAEAIDPTYMIESGERVYYETNIPVQEPEIEEPTEEGVEE